MPNIEQRMTPEQDARVAELYNQGVVLREIAAELGISQGSVYPALRRLGIEPGRQRKEPQRDTQRRISDQDLAAQLALVNARVTELAVAVRDLLVEHGRVLERLSNALQRLDDIERHENA